MADFKSRVIELKTIIQSVDNVIWKETKW